MGWLSDLLKDLPALAVAQERIALVEKQYEVMKKENESLKEDTARLGAENKVLKAQLSKLQTPEPQGPGELSATEVHILEIIESEAPDEGITAVLSAREPHSS